MDDFERAVLISFSGHVDAALKERADSFIAEIKLSPDAWQLCVERFSVTQYSEVKFWCLQTLHELICVAYPNLHAPVRDTIKTALLTWVTRDCTDAQIVLPPFLRNKVAQTLVAILQHEYPSTWPGFFQDLLRAVLPQSQLSAAGVGGRPSGTLAAPSPGCDGMVDMFCRILVSVDEDLVSLDIPRSQDASKLSMHVKDSMREHSVADIAAAWQLLSEAYATKSPSLAAFILSTMQRYISWIDIGLVANDKFVSMLESFVDDATAPIGLKTAAADCLSEIVAKRMDAVPKLDLVQRMSIVPRCLTWAAGFPNPTHGPRRPRGMPASAPLGDEDLLLKLARLLSTVAGEIMDALKKVENGVISLTALGIGVTDEAAQEAGSAAQLASQMLDQLFPAVLSAFRSEVDEVALPLLPFMSNYVARLKLLQKRNAGLSETSVAHAYAIFEGVSSCTRYPSDSQFDAYAAPQLPVLNGHANIVSSARTSAVPSSAGGRMTINTAAKDEQTQVEEKRRDVFVLFKNLGKTVYSEAMVFLARSLQSIIGQSTNVSVSQQQQQDTRSHMSHPGVETPWQDVEIALALLYEIGESGIDDMAKPNCGSLAPLVTALAHACCDSGGAAESAHPGGTYGGVANGASAAAGSDLARAAGTEDGPHALGIHALPHSHHPLIALMVLELFVRYSKVLASNVSLLSTVLLVFVDGRGMDHQVEEVSTRACYLFSRLCKSLRGQLRHYLPAILPRLTPILSRVLSTPIMDSPAGQASRDIASKMAAPVNAVVDDRLYVFEAVGLLLGQEEVDAQQQAAALGTLLQLLTDQIQHNLRSMPGGAAAGPRAPGMIIQAMEATVRLSKGFRTDLTTRQRPQLGRMFVGMFEVALAVPREYPEHILLRARFISCVHRLVEGLQGLLVPLLPSALEPLVLRGPQRSPETLTDVLVLANQLVCKFKEALAPLMEGLLPIVVTQLYSILDYSWDWSGRGAAPTVSSPITNSPAGTSGGAPPRVLSVSAPGSVSRVGSGMSTSLSGYVTATLEEAREKSELQRAFYSLIHSVSHNALSNVLLVHDPSTLLEPVMTALTRGATSHVDPAIRRTCVQVYCRLITEWCSNGSAETIPGFKRYAMEHLGGEACILGMLQSQPPLETRDGATIALLQDLSAALKLVYERCGDEFSAHLLTVVGPAAGLPQAYTEQLVSAVRVSDVKELRDCLRLLLDQSQQAARAQGTLIK